VREKLGVWPALPVVVTCFGDSELKVDNVIAALERTVMFEVVLMHPPGPDWRSLKKRLVSGAAAIPGTDKLVDLHRACNNNSAYERSHFRGFWSGFSSCTDLADLRLLDISPETEATVTCPSTVDKTLTGKVDSYPGPARTIFPGRQFLSLNTDLYPVLAASPHHRRTPPHLRRCIFATTLARQTTTTNGVSWG
jgi:hypothetical protein